MALERGKLRYEIPEGAVLIGRAKREPIYYNDGFFYHGTTGMHHQVALTHEQQILFTTLTNNIGKYVNFKTLLHAYLGNPSDYTPDPLEIGIVLHPAMTRLRKELNKIDITIKDSLKTKRGVGYRYSIESEEQSTSNRPVR